MPLELSWRRRLLHSTIVLVFLVLFLEALLQAHYYFSVGEFLFRRGTLPIFELDETRCYRVKPSLDYMHRTNEFAARIYTNALGLRTDATRATIPVEKADHVYRILLLGPSLAFGWGNNYEDSFASRIAHQLEVPGKRVELLNLGTPAQDLKPQLCWLRQEGRAYRPDLVLETLYGDVPSLPSDCPESLSCPIVEDGKLYTVPPTLSRRLFNRVKNFAVVFYGYYLISTLTASPAPDGLGMGKELSGDEAAEPAASDLETLVEEFTRNAAFVKEVIGGETEVVFLYIPMSFVVHPEYAPRWRHITEVDPAASRAWSRAQADALRERGIAFIDTTARLIAAGEREPMYFWLDVHPTPAGNRVIADAAVDALEELISARSRKQEESD